MYFEVLPLDGDAGGPWVPWWGSGIPQYAGRPHSGIGLGVGATKNKHLTLRRYNIAQAPQILVSETLYEG